MHRTDPVVSIAISADTSLPQLKAYAEDLKQRLQRYPGISLVEIQGFSDHQTRVELSLPLLRRYELSIADIARQLARQNIRLPSGTIETTDRNILIRFDQQRVAPKDLASVVVAGNVGGAEVRLSDIATITDRFELDEERIDFNGKPAALLAVSKNKTEDALDALAQVKSFLAEEEDKRKPAGVTLTLTQDTTSLINDRLTMLLKNGWQGFILVFLTTCLFFSIRYAFWVAMGLPVSFLGALFVMSLLGTTLNMVSLVGLLLAVGLLVDDAIVIAESVAAHVEKGHDSLEGAVLAIKQVGPGVFSSFLTTIAIFGGLAFIGGDIGKVLKIMPIVLIMTLTVSLVEAFLILPHHLVHSLESAGSAKRSPWKAKVAFTRWFDQLRVEKLPRLVEWLIRRRYLFLGSVFGFLLVSLALPAGGFLGFKAFPDLEGDLLEVEILLTPGSPMRQTERMVQRIVGAVEQLNRELTPLQRDEQSLVQNITVEYNKNMDAFDRGQHVATVTLDLLSVEVRNTRMSEVINTLRERIGQPPDVLSLIIKEPRFGPAGRAIEVRLQHDDLEILTRASRELQGWLQGYEGVKNILDDTRPGKEEIRLRLRPGATAYGVDAELIASQVRAAFYGVTADEVQVGTENIELDVRLTEYDRSRPADFENFPVVAPDGSQIPLATVAELKHARGFSRINRVDKRRTITVYGDVDPKKTNTVEVINDTRQRFVPQLIQRFPGLQAIYEGEIKEGDETRTSIRNRFLLGLLLVFLILSYQFRSYTEPVVVMLAIPMALIGVLWGHLIFGYDLTMPSIVGFVSLAGIVVNDSILLVQFIKQHIRDGLPAAQAGVEASRERFRAVFMTSATTIACLLPLLVEQNVQAQIMIPMVISIVFGISTSTLLVLLVIPAFYTILDDFGLSRAGN